MNEELKNLLKEKNLEKQKMAKSYNNRVQNSFYFWCQFIIIY